MKYMLLVYSDEKAWTTEKWTACTIQSTEICRELAMQGQFIGAAPLHPVATAQTFQLRSGHKLVTDGPFAETTEQLGGYFLIDVPNLGQAIALAARVPAASKGTVEIRPLFELHGLPTSKLRNSTIRFQTNRSNPMRVMVIVKASTDSEAGKLPTEELLTAMGKFNEELVSAGLMLEGAGLKPTSAGARVQFSGPNRTVLTGPFTATKELIAGYWIWRVKSMAEAIEWVKRCPNPMPTDSEIEIRPFYEAEDFGAEFTPEMREQEAAVHATTLGLNRPTFEVRNDLQLHGLNRSYNMESRLEIPQQWEQFMSRVKSFPKIMQATFYGVSWNNKANNDFDYLCGMEADPNQSMPSHFTTLNLTPRRYAIFPHTSHVSAIPKTLETIWSKWAPDCGLKIAPSPCIEIYTSEFDANTGMGGMEVWIPLDDA